MKRIFIAKTLTLTTVCLLLMNLILPSFNSVSNEYFPVKEKTNHRSARLYHTDSKLIEFVNEATEESFEEIDTEDFEKNFADFSFFDFNTFIHERSFKLNLKLKNNFLHQAKQQSIPLWLFVRHILI